MLRSILLRSQTPLILTLFLVSLHCRTPALEASPTATPNSPATTRDNTFWLKKCEASLNQFKTLKARFVQIGPDGQPVYGRFYLRRPDRMRLEYESTIPLRIVADSRQLTYYDKELKDKTYFSTDGHPVALFLQPQIVFAKAGVVQAIEQDASTVRITIAQKDADATADHASTITLVFHKHPVALHQWDIHDAQGQTTTVTLVDVQTDVRLPPELFSIEHEDTTS